MYCGTCGTQATPGASYCLRCGTRLVQPLDGPSTAGVADTPGAPAPNAQPAYPVVQPVPPATPGPPISQYPPGYGPPPGFGPPPGYSATPGYAYTPMAPAGDVAGAAPVLAPWWKRFVAMIIDCCVLGAFYFIVLIVVGVIVNGQNGTTTTTTSPTDSAQVALGVVVLVILASIPNALYFGLMNGSTRGQTFGKMALGVAVRDARTYERIGFARGIGRSLIVVVFEIAAFIPFIVDALSPLWDKRRQAWHDRVVGSVVVDLRP